MEEISHNLAICPDSLHLTIGYMAVRLKHIVDNEDRYTEQNSLLCIYNHKKHLSEVILGIKMYKPAKNYFNVATPPVDEFLQGKFSFDR